MALCKRTPAGRALDAAWLSELLAESIATVTRAPGFTCIKPAPPRPVWIDPATRLKRKPRVIKVKGSSVSDSERFRLMAEAL